MQIRKNKIIHSEKRGVKRELKVKIQTSGIVVEEEL